MSNFSSYSYVASNEQKYKDFIYVLLRICKLSVNQVCNDGNWNWWVAHVGSLLIGMIGIAANVISFLIFHNKCKKSSYINLLKYLAITDSLCLLIEFTRSLNTILIHVESVYSFTLETNFTCKFFNYTASTLQLISAWLVCLFTIERCVAINSPFSVRRIFNIKKTRFIFLLIVFYSFLSQLFRLFLVESSCPLVQFSNRTSILNRTTTFDNCLTRCKCEAVSNEYGVFLLKFHVYAHQLISIVVIPSIIVIACNTIVIYRIIQRKRMLHTNQSKYRKKVHKVKNDRQEIGHLEYKPSKRFSKGDQETRVISKKQVKLRRQTIYLLILVSISFLVLVLPDTVLNIYKFIYLKKLVDEGNTSGKENGISFNKILNFCNQMEFLVVNIQIFEDMFFLLKLTNYASTCFIYLSLGNSLNFTNCSPNSDMQRNRNSLVYRFSEKRRSRRTLSTSSTTTFEMTKPAINENKKFMRQSQSFSISSNNNKKLNKKFFQEDLN